MTWLRRHAGPLLLIYLLVLAVVLFSPSNTVQTDAVTGGSDLLIRLGVADTHHLRVWAEFAENVLIIAPVTFFASLLRPRHTWLEWTAMGFLAALVVEAFQALFLSGRIASFSDVVANTLGALVGAVVVRVLQPPHR